MHTFRDDDGREWEIELKYSSVKRIADKLGEKLLDVPRGTEDDMLMDWMRLVPVLYELTKRQCDDFGIKSADEFGDRMSSESASRARQALVEEIAFFSPDRELAEWWIKEWHKQQEERAPAILRALSRQLDEEASNPTDRAGGEPSTAREIAESAGRARERSSG